MDQERAWHALPADQVLTALSTSPAGLDPAEARRRLAVHGPNQLPRAASDGLLALAWRQLDNPISWVLVVAGVVALALGKGTDAVVIFGAVFVNAAIGLAQEWRAEQAIAALSTLVADEAVVVRAGRPARVCADDLVPGDVVALEAGDKVPADLRLLRAHGLAADESALTGESVPVEKGVAAVAADAPLGDRACMAFGGTLITRGAGAGVVVETGTASELGRISALLERTERLTTPVMQQLTQVSAWIAAGVLATSLTLFGYALLVRDAPVGEALLVALTLAVAAIPEGLPPIITIALAIGVSRMAARRAVIRHLPAVETLGSTTVICSDKTGTLTRNEMTVQALWVAGQEYELSGVGYGGAGTLTCAGQALTERPPVLDALLACAVLCNDARLGERAGGPITGDPTEAALLVAARKAGIDDEALRSAWRRLDVVPFDSQVMFMATVDGRPGRTVVHLKGSVEAVLARCALHASAEAEARAVMESLAARGLRVLAFAARRLEVELTDVCGQELSAGGFEFLGLVGMIDLPRREAVEAVRACHAAGIVVKMITGDHPATASAVGRAVGILEAGEDAVTGAALERLDDGGLRRIALEGHVFARVAPIHKLRLVQALQEQGHVVAVTGDGVNDAPALKRADIGVAMGITGTAVARESAKVVLTDDNFASIAAAVEEGRRVFDNLVKALAFVLPTNLGIALILVAAMVLFPSVPVQAGQAVADELLLPMSPTQILWINLVSSVTLSVPIAFEALEPDAMRRRPRPRDKPILSKFVVERTLMVALVMAACACGLFLWEYGRMVDGEGPASMTAHRRALAEAQTMAVTTVVCFQAFYLLNCRSLRDSVRAVGLFSNPWVFVGIGALLLLQAAFVYVPACNALFGSSPLDALAWIDAALAGAIVVPVVAAEKWVRRRRARSTRATEPGGAPPPRPARPGRARVG